MRVKYNRVSHISQSGDRFTADTATYDLTLLDKISGTIAFSERPKAKELIRLIETATVTELTVEELSRLGRSTGNVIQTLEWLDQWEINVIVRNLGLQSRPNGKKNPVWKMVTSTLSSLYEMELENIRERTMVGRLVYVQNGGQLGRPSGTGESGKEFMEKPKSREIAKNLKKGLSVRQVAKIVDASTRTVLKVKKLLAA